MKGVVLAAGKGTRMREVTRGIAKPMLPVANKPILEHILDSLREGGIRELLFVVSYMKEQITDYFGDGREFGVRIDYAVQHEMKGTGQAAMMAEEFASGDDFALMFGDIMTPGKNVPGLLDTFRRHEPFMVLTVRRVDDPWNGAAVYVKDGTVTKIIEKPPKGSSTTNYDNAGIFVFSNGIFDLLRELKLSPRGEYELTDAIQEAVSRDLGVRAYELDGYWSNVSSPEDLIQTNGLVLEEAGKEASVHENARIGEGCRIGPNACVMEGAFIGRGCMVSNSVVSSGARLGDGSVLDYVFAGEGAVVPEKSRHVGNAERVVIISG